MRHWALQEPGKLWRTPFGERFALASWLLRAVNRRVMVNGTPD
jgi:hypothetical protein